MFMEQDFLANIPPAAAHDSDVFRKARLYTTEVDAVFTRYSAPLETVFNFYAMPGGHQISMKGHGKETRQEPRLSCDEFITMLTDSKLLYADTTETNLAELRQAGKIDERQARLCHTWSIAFCSDELRRREKYTSANYVDFLEMLGRICTFMPLPTNDQLKLYHAKSAMEYLDHVDEGKHEGSVLIKEGTTWESEETSEECLSAPLEMLINLILDRLDSDGAVKSDAAQLEFIRVERQKKEEAFLARRESSARLELGKGGGKAKR